jgi:tetratricopeptide (TPR) repeat protein
MKIKKKPTTGNTSIEISGMRSDQPSYTRIAQNFRLIWLDKNIDDINNNDCRNAITKLRQVINVIDTFNNADKCIDFITDIRGEKIFIIVSGIFTKGVVPIIQDISQVSSVYIFCGNKTSYDQWAQHWSKVKGVYTDITPICEALKLAAQDCDQNSVSISFLRTNDGASSQNLNQLDQSFMYTQLLKEILLTIDFKQGHMNEFITYCRVQLAGNAIELKNIDRLQREYHCHQPIWWYTYDCFLYSMLNRALRMMEVDIIIKMGFFMRDLYQHITALHTEQYAGYNHSNSFIVYRGQGLCRTDFEQLKEMKGGLLSFNNFLSTSKNRNVSLAFAQRTAAMSNLVGMLFVMKIDPSMSATPFANVSNVSYYQTEEEILFSMHSVFRIGQMKQIDENSHLWQVELLLTSDNDPQLHALTESMREQTKGSTGWYRLGDLLLTLGYFDKAEELYNIILQQTSNEDEKVHIYNYLGRIVAQQGKYTEAITIYEKALKLHQNTLPPNHPHLATSYNNIGLVYDNMNDYTKALSSYEKAMEIKQKIFPSNHPSLATTYNNTGLVYCKMGEYSKALSYYEKDLKIKEKSLPSNHPDLATSYNNIGLMHHNMGEYTKALVYYEKALRIRQKIFPPNHPHLAASYNNIGSAYDKMIEYPKALSYYEKALEVWKRTLSPNYPHLATSYNNIGTVYDRMGEYSKALSYYKKAFETHKKILS